VADAKKEDTDTNALGIKETRPGILNSPVIVTADDAKRKDKDIVAYKATAQTTAKRQHVNPIHIILIGLSSPLFFYSRLMLQKSFGV
jgi:hypothetical protein